MKFAWILSKAMLYKGVIATVITVAFWIGQSILTWRPVKTDGGHEPTSLAPFCSWGFNAGYAWGL
jgi:hypothetical protein